MSLRGRGTLEIRPSDNPFFQPTSRDIGNTAADHVEWKVSGRPPQFPTVKHSVDGNFAFLYTRESDMIGAKVPKPQTMSETKMLTRTEFLKARREKALSESTGLDLSEDNIHHEPSRPKATAEEILKVYKHEPKYEDPRYITSNVSPPLSRHNASHLILITVYNSLVLRLIMAKRHHQ